MGLARQIGAVGRWPVGMGLASWRYLWRTSPLHRVDQQGTADDVGPQIPDALVDQVVQGSRDGVGPLFRRRYAVRIEDPSMTPEQLIAAIARNPNRAAPVEVAFFRKTRGENGPLQAGDEYVVRMPGPWDGPVRVVDRSPTSFRLATLRGHLEAGQIEFRARTEDGALRFEIESWARSGDRLSALLYDRVRLVKEMQLHVWTHFCERIGRLAGGHIRGGIQIDTRRVEDCPVSEAQPLDDAARRALDQLHDKGLNFDLDQRGEFTRENGWQVDDYRQPLPPEPPGRPLPDGSWQAARRLIRDYAFADPSIIRAVYYPDRPLGQRDMLLEGRFLGLRFYFGCRVGGINDQLRTIDARQVQVWGWSYRTLQGHLEMGQMDYEVWKWLDSGTVEFRIHVVSKPAHVPDPVVRLGFRVFGRAMQRRFARHACRRMAQLTTAALDRGPRHGGGQPAPPWSGQLTVTPAADRTRAQRRLARNAAVPTTRDDEPRRSRMPTATPFTRVLLLGAVAGMRSQLPIALLGLESLRGRFDLGSNWLARRLVTPGGVAAAALASVGELVGDKLPAIPDRTRPGPFTGRVAVGTLVGAAVYQDADRPAAYGTVVGAVAAAASTLALARARTALGRRTPLPDRAWGIVEDALALTLGLLAVRSRPEACTQPNHPSSHAVAQLPQRTASAFVLLARTPSFLNEL